MLLLSILYQLLSWMLGLSAVLMRRDLSKDACHVTVGPRHTIIMVARIASFTQATGVADFWNPRGALQPKIGQQITRLWQSNID